MKPLTKKPSWEEILGKNIHELTAGQRRKNWLLMKNLLDKEVVEYWENAEGCTERGNCIHKMNDEGWCNLQGLPCGFNPITKIVGMACMGTSYTPEDEIRKCRVCGCTDLDCSGCIERTGEPCSWVEDDLCSACKQTTFTFQ